MAEREGGRVEREEFDAYPPPKLIEPYRSPSRGGNTGAEHRHAIQVAGVWYSWFAVGAKKWAHAGERVSFDCVVSGEYCNVEPNTFRSFDRDGNETVHGERGPRLGKRRTATQRLPGRKNE